MEDKAEYKVEPPPASRVQVYDQLDEAEIIQEAIAGLRQVFTPRQLLKISRKLVEIKQEGYGEYHLIFFNGHLDRAETVISSKLPRE